MSQLPIFPEGQIDLFIRCRVCARCYGDLESIEAPGYAPDNHIFLAYCPTCVDAWNYATVSRKYAEFLGQRALADKWEVQSNMPDLFPNPHLGKSTNQLLKELGF